MTEEEWLTGENPVPMGDFANESARASDRVCRLYVAAFWGWQARRLRKGKRRADLEQRVSVVEQWAEIGEPPKGIRATEGNLFFNHDARAMLHSTVCAPNPSWKALCDGAVRIQPPLLREVFGNPFRPVAPDSSWLTSDVVALARGIYAERAFDRMPILADALQDAGCTNDDVLNHCRDTAQVHARGCWVLDLLLGKS